jgi:MoaA/NifB/PqqE/SkfB family radical SAM enzyme
MDNRCLLPFNGRSQVLLHKNTVSACCKTPQYPIDPVTGILTPQLVELRKSVIDNERNIQCKNCWEIDDQGGPSYRRHSKHFTEKIEWEKLDPYQPVEHVELSFSNKCQMMCVYCSSLNSTMWEDSISKFSKFKNYIFDNSIVPPKVQDVLEINKLKEIYITGGEPLLEQECIKFLMELPFDGNRKITVITNLSYGPATFKVLQDIILKHRNLTVLSSLDAVGENLNRKYLNWELWKSNFKNLADNLQERIIDFPKIYLAVNVTVTILSYKEVQGVIEYILDYRKDGYKGITFDINPIANNQESSLQSGVIDPNYSLELSDKYKKILSKREKDSIIMFNDMLRNVKYNPELYKRTEVFLKEYFE